MKIAFHRRPDQQQRDRETKMEKQKFSPTSPHKKVTLVALKNLSEPEKTVDLIQNSLDNCYTLVIKNLQCID